jgi:predicted RNA-binding Zn ribbon-like protein
MEPQLVDERPAEIRLVQDFINTRDIEAGDDDVATADELGAWLGARGLLDPSGHVDPTEHRLALDLREALRHLLREGHDRVPDAAVEALNDLAAGLPLRVRFDEAGRATVAPGLPGVRGALGAILGEVAVAMSTGSWERLKACSSHSCQWIFYDRSKNRSGRWCSMRVCGNRTKTRSYRRRRGAEPAHLH